MTPSRTDALRRELQATGSNGPTQPMSNLTIKAAADCRFDEVSLGEVMLRLDPGEGRDPHDPHLPAPGKAAASTTSRAACAAASACAPRIVTALADNPVGRLVEDLMLQGGVDLSLPALGASTTASAATRPQRPQLHRARLRPARRRRLLRPRPHRRRAAAAGRRRLGAIFGGAGQGARWFHTGGIFCGAVGDDARASRARPWRRRDAHGTASRTTSTTATRSGGPSAARRRRARSTAR